MPSQKVLNELRDLHREFLDLGNAVEALVAEAVCAIQIPDSAVVTLFAGCDALAEQERRIADRCRRIVLLYQPMARDFREVTAILRMSAEFGHIGILASEIIEHSVALTALPVSVPEELTRLTEVVSGLVRRALDAYTLLDAVPVRPVAWFRTEVRALVRVLTDWLSRAMRAESAAVEPGMHLFAVLQNLQHIAEHASALAEEIAFLTDAPGSRANADLAPASPREPADRIHRAS